ncbi:MAG: A/G-specific adenine glycosylase [Candidatus Methanofastidiosa archaeon]|nr:A/G-specific adenine glycosylase [Candidatus Methanofastidiosa archaeon]
MDDTSLQKFRERVWSAYRESYRDLPWRRTDDPYAILVSEVMLQQTQVHRVIVPYERFLSAYPTVSALAKASPRDVVALWQGLGYNRRALWLREAARRIVTDHGGIVPADVETLLTLPGIGPYTAAAVCAIAFGQVVPVLDTNIRAVYLHEWFPQREKIRDSELIPLLVETFDRERPREWVYALMDYGATLKRQGPNPSRRSAHHVRQQAFEGSRRQRRGKVIRLLLACESATAQEVAASCGMKDAEAEALLIDLAAEGFLSIRDGAYCLSP